MGAAGAAGSRGCHAHSRSPIGSSNRARAPRVRCVLRTTSPAQAWATNNDEFLSQFIPSSAAVPIVISGVTLMIVAVLGVIGTYFNRKLVGRFILGVYAFVLSLTVLLEIISAGILLQGTGRLGDASADDSFNPINALINNTFEACCVNGTVQPTCFVPRDAGIVTEANCKQPLAFRAALIGWIDKNVDIIVGVTLFFAIVEILTMLATCFVSCRGSRLARAADDKINIRGITIDESDYGDVVPGASAKPAPAK